MINPRAFFNKWKITEKNLTFGKSGDKITAVKK